jgi:hypothetical protein
MPAKSCYLSAESAGSSPCALDQSRSNAPSSTASDPRVDPPALDVWHHLEGFVGVPVEEGETVMLSRLYTAWSRAVVLNGLLSTAVQGPAGWGGSLVWPVM